MKGRFLKHNIGNLEKKVIAADGKTGCTRTQPTYLMSEEEDILDYIVEEQKYSKTGTKSLFKEMAAKRVVEGRTWESLRLHFRVIRKNLDSYDFLTEEQKIWLRER